MPPFKKDRGTRVGGKMINFWEGFLANVHKKSRNWNLRNYFPKAKHFEQEIAY